MRLPRTKLACALFAMTALGACIGAAGSGIVTTFGSNVVPYVPGQRKAAPPVGGESLRPGPKIESSLLAGKVAVVNFWGSWCGPCRREEPILEATWKRYSARGVRFIGVDTRRDQKTAALAFADEFGVTYPLIYDPDSSIAFAFGVRFMPATFVIDRHGAIAAQYIGAVPSPQSIAALLDQELAP